MKKFKKRRKKLHTRKVFLLNSILVVFMFLGIGYSLLSTELTIDGSTKVNEYLEPTLYNVLYKEAKTNGLAREYTGSHQDSFTQNPSKKIYHWYGSNNTNGTAILDKNNVVFAEQCWQMIRTTDTGGVKMIYNGEAENNQCLSTRGTHVGYASRTSQNLASNYWYGTDYTYDTNTQLFKIAGTTEQTTWNESNGPGLVGKYTCKSTSVDGTCATLYLVESYYNTTSAYVIPLNSNSNYSHFGTLQFNASRNSPAYVGYMYGDVYEYSTTSGTTSQSFATTQTILSNRGYSGFIGYGDDVLYDNSTGKYTLVNFTRTKPDNLTGIYIGNYDNNPISSVVYVANQPLDSSLYYSITLENGNLLSDYEPIVFGDSISDNGDGTYTINNPTNVTLSDWYTNYATYVNKYTCNDSSTTCASPRYTTATTSTNYTYINAGEKIMIGKTRNRLTLTDTVLVRKDELVINSSNYSDYKYTCNTDSATCTEATLRMISGYNTIGYKYAPNHYYGSSVTWDGTNYTLVDPIEIENYNNMNNISTHHYICVSPGLKTCATVAYVYYYTGSGTMYYITLKDGVTTVDKALEDMLTKNTTNSTMKNGVDAWYKHYMLDYDDYIEDTIFCNDRSIRALKGWNSDGGMTNAYLQFKEYNVTSDLSCTNITDQFSISNNNAKLTYKVGLMSSPEMNILNNSNARKTGQSYWLASPFYFDGNSALVRYVYAFGSMNYDGVMYTYGVRPAVSLTPGIEYSDGDGSMANPYIVDAEARRYVYSTSTENTKGALVSELGSTYRTGIEAINGFNKRVVLNHRIENDRVISSGVTFERNGIIYTLYGEGSTYNDSTGEYNEDSIYYDDNKQTLKYAFGEDNCTEYTTPEKYYECTDGSEVGAVRASGRVGVEINHWYCRDFQDGTFHCRQY